MFDFLRSCARWVQTTRRPNRKTRRAGAWRPSAEWLERRELLTTYVVTSNADSGLTSLRGAILASNANSGQANTIDFHMPAQTAANPLPNDIVLASPLPAITNSVVIDGTTDPGYANNGGVPYVSINGDNISSSAAIAAGTAVGLTINAQGCTVKGLIIIGFGSDGMVVNSNDNVIQADQLGFAGGGLGAVAKTPNGRGIQVNGNFNTIGGATASTRNFIADNAAAGIALAGPHNTVLGNYIGVESDGLTAKGNATGVLVLSASNVIGGIATADANVISGNTGYGIVIGQVGGTGIANNDVFDNLIGLSANGKTGVGNGSGGTGGGVEIFAGANNNLINNNTIDDNLNGPGVFVTGAGTNNNSINGDDIGFLPSNNQPVGNFGDGVLLFAGAQNNIVGTPQDPDVLSGNALYGVGISGSGTNDNTVADDFIGTDPTGMTALGNGSGGVFIGGGASGNVIGGAGVGNVISGNLGAGISFTTAATDNYVEANTIGVNAAGNAVLPNKGDGVFIGAGADFNYIGYNAANAGNVISGNTQAGVEIDGVGATLNLVYGNFIGTNAGGTVAMPNLNGVLIHGLASTNYIGGTGSNEADCISGNTNNGVTISDAGTTGNFVLGDQIGANSAGTAALPNGADGVLIDAGATANNIGANVAFQGNLISGNGGDGIDIRDSGTSQNVVVANLIGTNLADNGALPNGAGVVIQLGATDNTIGGAAAGDNNVISGNAGSGVEITGDALPGDFIEDNEIGTNQNGTTALPNQQSGVLLQVGATNNTVTGNLISGNMQDGIFITQASTNNTVEGNTIGLNAAGTAALGNHGNGVRILSASINFIGGNTPAERNIISGNSGDGVEVIGAGATYNAIIGNYIGTNSAGSASIANGGDGVDLQGGAVNTSVGEADIAGSGNLISGNAKAGVEIYGESPGLGNATDNTIESNRIGTDATGTFALANVVAGVFIQNGAVNNTVFNDLVSGNKYGVEISDDTTANNSVDGCLIGTNGSDSGALPNTTAGVFITAQASDNTIGSNVISGNTLDGVLISGVGTTGNKIVSNQIGTEGDGLTPLPNHLGVLINLGASGNTVGGTGAGNVIDDNTNDGVDISGSNSTDNTVSSNDIYGNGSLGIDLGAGIVANTLNGPHVGPNDFQNTPILVNDSTPGLVTGYLNSTPSTTFTLEFFASPTGDNTNPGEGRDLLGSTTVTTDLAGNVDFSFAFTPLLGVPFLTATATSASGDTSEFSPSLAAGLTCNGLALTGYLSVPFTGTVATFTDANPLVQASSFTATINWGDGSTSAGTVIAGTNNSFTVAGSHQYVYASAASELPVTVTITDLTSNTQTNANSTMNLVYGLHAGSNLSAQYSVDEPATNLLAVFTDSDPNTIVGDYGASIYWNYTGLPNTSLPSAGTITQDGSGFAISGTHTYTQSGDFDILIVFSSHFGPNTFAYCIAEVSQQSTNFTGVAKTVPYIEGVGPTAGATESTALSNSDFNGSYAQSYATESNPSAVVASFFDTDPHAFAGLYSATINWGDTATGAPADTSTGTVVADGSGFDVVGNHIYAQAGTYPMTVTVTDVYGGSVTINSTADVSLQPLTLNGVSVAVPANTTFNGIVATLDDPDPRTDPTFYTATVTWDNGTTSPGTVTGSNPFTITASHAFGAFNNTAIETVTVTDKLGRTVTVSDRFVDPPGTEAPAEGTAGVKYDHTIAIAGGTRPGSSVTLSDFSDGGTGLTAAAITINAAARTIVVNGTPPAPGTASFTVHLTDATGDQVTQEYSITINAAPALGTLTVSQWTKGSSGFTGVSTISGGTGPFKLLSATGLPVGMRAVLTGDTIHFTGTPAAAKTYAAHLTVRDAVGAVVAQTFDITIDPAPTLGNLTATQWTVGAAGFTGVSTIHGGTGPFTLVHAVGLPTGMSAVVVGDTIQFTGTPTIAKRYVAVITVRDADGATVAKSFTITIKAPVK